MLDTAGSNVCNDIVADAVNLMYYSEITARSGSSAPSAYNFVDQVDDVVRREIACERCVETSRAAPTDSFPVEVSRVMAAQNHEHLIRLQQELLTFDVDPGLFESFEGLRNLTSADSPSPLELACHTLELVFYVWRLELHSLRTPAPLRLMLRGLVLMMLMPLWR